MAIDPYQTDEMPSLSLDLHLYGLGHSGEVEALVVFIAATNDKLVFACHQGNLIATCPVFAE